MDKMVNLRINGRQVRARAGQTVLEAAKAAGIDIPNLCNHPALTPSWRLPGLSRRDRETAHPSTCLHLSGGRRNESGNRITQGG